MASNDPPNSDLDPTQENPTRPRGFQYNQPLLSSLFYWWLLEFTPPPPPDLALENRQNKKVGDYSKMCQEKKVTQFFWEAEEGGIWKDFDGGFPWRLSNRHLVWFCRLYYGKRRRKERRKSLEFPQVKKSEVAAAAAVESSNLAGKRRRGGQQLFQSVYKTIRALSNVGFQKT